jgi:CBS domain-containing protein
VAHGTSKRRSLTRVTWADVIVLRTDRTSLPVVDGGRLIGILTVTDVLRVFVEQNEEIAA